jgi:hypothetical protein
MTFEIYHQIGHNGSWNLESITQDKVGDGIIISPRNMNKKAVERLPSSIREKSIFDPQFFNPHQVNKNMQSYGFYPETVMPSGFGTASYVEYADICASECINFQQRLNFRYYVIPTRYTDSISNIDTFIDYQSEHYINPFLQAVAENGSDKEVIIQLVLNGHAIKNEILTTELLNWITSIEKINGVYLVTELAPRGKQIKDPRFLYSLLKFIDALVQNELKVVLGYLNTEAILLSIASPSIVTIGSYENVRIFRSETFDNEKRDMRSPRPRIFIPNLLDWVNVEFIELLIMEFPEYKRYLGDNTYTDEILSPSYNISGVKIPYKHFFVESSKQLKRISQLEGAERAIKVCQTIESAIREHARLREAGIMLDDADHLNSWLTAANLFMKERGWRS